MEAAVPWHRLEALIAPHYIKPRKGRPQMPLAVMLRNYFLQQWCGLSDPGAEEALYDMHSMRDFAGLDLARDAIPDETTILNFRHLLEKHNLTDDLIRPDDTIIFGDKGYVSDKRKRATRARGATWAVKDKRKPGRILSTSQKKRNKKYGRVRAKVPSHACWHAPIGSGARVPGVRIDHISLDPKSSMK